MSCRHFVFLVRYHIYTFSFKIMHVISIDLSICSLHGWRGYARKNRVLVLEPQVLNYLFPILLEAIGRGIAAKTFVFDTALNPKMLDYSLFAKNSFLQNILKYVYLIFYYFIDRNNWLHSTLSKRTPV